MIDPTGTVSRSGDVMKTRAYRYSFQESVNAKIVDEKIPGSESGRMIRHTTPSHEAPSIRAPSPISPGRDWNKPIRGHVRRGTGKAGRGWADANSRPNSLRGRRRSASG